MTSDLDGLLTRVCTGMPPYWATLGMQPERVDAPGHLVMSLPIREDLGTRRHEVMHGGAIASLIDGTAGGAVLTLQEEGDDSWLGQATLDLNVTFLNAAMTDVTAEAKVLRSSRTLAFLSVEVRDTAGELVAVGRATYAIIRKR